MGQDVGYAQRESHLGKKGGFTVKYSIKMGFMTGGFLLGGDIPLYSEARERGRCLAPCFPKPHFRVILVLHPVGGWFLGLLVLGIIPWKGDFLLFPA